MKNMNAILQSLGFLESEIKTYMAALKNGPGTVIELTKLTRLSRQATYVAIETLTDRGLMTSVLKGKKRYYVSEDPDKLLSYAQRKEHELKDRIGDLKRALPEMKLKAGGDRPVVKLYEGVEGVKAIFEDMKTSKPKLIREIADTVAVSAILSDEELIPLHKAMKQIKTETQGIYTAERLRGVLDTKIDYLPKELSDFKSSIIIYEDKIAMLTFEGKIFGIIIESKLLAKAAEILYTLGREGLKARKSVR